MLQWQWVHHHPPHNLHCCGLFNLSPSYDSHQTTRTSGGGGSTSLAFHLKPKSKLTSLTLSLSLSPVSARPRAQPQDDDDGGPVELYPSTPPIFATTDDPSPIQVATSLLLTGAISVFLFRSIRRRARRAKQLKVRSSGTAEKTTLKEEALESLKAMGAAGPVEAEKKPASALQALLGGISAGIIALILYKFTTTIEDGLNRQALSDNFSVRQITITIRTVVNGLCYLATFVFGVNSVGLFLYSAQRALGGGTTADASPTKPTAPQSDSSSSSSASASEPAKSSNQEDPNPDNIKNE
ncbi:hypothetical protein Tsubulata_000915 [Turnera subulata]|uniref:Transmembrane protein n=1 Tax=Turnera subulata TaxID=218843 RepID=A0A9Q0G4X9_9ROSI|nr:hypothetical protein Tsubulata_000915 [Turnera subulata]